jgi:DNA processing protein
MGVAMRASGDPGYPVGLSDLEEPPTLYILGELEEPPGVAVVGTRRCTRYGLDLAIAFGVSIARAGWATVSGLARGIDAAAHRGCLEAGGHAVAVLGSGVDVCYPAENRPLYDRVLASGGSVVSEYPPGTPPDRWRFPARNRIIAALSAAVVVVEAAETGGALITARLAAEMGRPVFVVPGDVDRPASVGCNRLIKDGAHPVLGPRDLIEELELVIGPARRPEPAARHPIPEQGVAVDDLSALWGVGAGEALAILGRMELEGSARRSGVSVFPV